MWISEDGERTTNLPMDAELKHAGNVGSTSCLLPLDCLQVRLPQLLQTLLNSHATIFSPNEDLCAL